MSATEAAKIPGETGSRRVEAVIVLGISYADERDLPSLREAAGYIADVLTEHLQDVHGMETSATAVSAALMQPGPVETGRERSPDAIGRDAQAAARRADRGASVLTADGRPVAAIVPLG